LNPTTEVPQMDESEPQPEEDQRKEALKQASQDLQESFDCAEHSEDLPPDVHPYLGKLEQEGNFVCPESIEEPAEEVDGLILYQTVEERSMDNSLDTEAFMHNAAGEFAQMQEIPQNSRGSGGALGEDLADQVDEISEGQVARGSLRDAAGVRACEETAEKAEAKTSEMELENIYSEFAQPSHPSVSDSEQSKCAEMTRENDGAKTEVSTNQEDFEGSAEDLNSPDGSRDCRRRALLFSRDQDSKVHVLDQSEMKMASALPSNSTDTKPSDLKFSLQQTSGEKKPEELAVPIKVEVTKTETVEDVCPDSSEVKHSHFFSYPVKSEDLVTKAEQLEYPVKAPSLEEKPEDLSLPMKPENFDTKPEVLQFVAYSDGSEVKPDVKPSALRFTAFTVEVYVRYIFLTRPFSIRSHVLLRNLLSYS